jgi:hypothetical protein
VNSVVSAEERIFKTREKNDRNMPKEWKSIGCLEELADLNPERE